MKRVSCALATAFVICCGLAPYHADAATCAVPNIIANGQVADASKLMADLNAVAICAQQGVTTTGTTTTGSISVFSAPQAITSGNLSGDVITSGSTSTTLSNSGVAAGVYGDASHIAQVTIDAKGRITSAISTPLAGTAGTGLYAKTMSATPTIANTGLSNVQGSGASQVDTPVGVNLSESGSGGAIEYTTAVPSTPYSVTALLALNSLTGVAALGWTDGTRDQFIYANGGSLIIQNNANLSTWDSTAINVAGGFEARLIWLRIRDDGTNITYYYSSDGYTFLAAYSAPKSSAFLGSSGYTHIMVGAPGGIGAAGVTVMSWAVGT